MTMHLAHPALTTTGRRKGRQKWASAEQKRQAQELEQQWQSKIQEFNKMSKTIRPQPKKAPMTSLSPKIPPGRFSSRHIPSVDSNHRGAVSSPSPMQYTGNKVLGIAVQHKSCLQPIFNQESAVDSAHMRR